MNSAHSKLSALGQFDEIAEQYERRYLKASPDEAREVISRRAAFSSGATAHFIFIAPETKTFTLHTELREALASTFSSLEISGQQPLIDLSHLDLSDQERVLRAIAFLLATANWEPIQFGKRIQKSTQRKSAKTSLKSAIEISVITSIKEKQAQIDVERALLLGAANNEVRTLADLPANELTPGHYRKRIQGLAQAHGLLYEFWDHKELTRRKAGAFLAVTRADPHSEGGIACIQYIPKKRSKKTKVLALVGKGICFDTGGYNIKGGSSMLGMHGDMTGSALAFALVGFFAQMKVDFEVRAYLALAENLISPTAYKPNECVIASDGTSIEVVDTDAEGRMILSDTLAQARLGKPNLMIDFATLTGAAVRALDTRKSAVFSNDRKLAERAVECGEAVGERLWWFPIDEDYKKGLKSKIADLLQCSSSNAADHIYAAAFLSNFAGAETPWLHVDLSACENKGGLGLISSDTTGFGVLWAAHFVSEYFS